MIDKVDSEAVFKSRLKLDIKRRVLPNFKAA